MPESIEQATAAPGETRRIDIPDVVDDHPCEVASSTSIGTLQTCSTCGAQWTRVR